MSNTGVKGLPVLRSLTYSIQQKSFVMAEHKSIDSLLKPDQRYYLLKNFPSASDTDKSIWPPQINEEQFGSKTFNYLLHYKDQLNLD